MKTIENVTLFRCDFCSKELKRKHAMENHENQCGRNPVNDRPCLNGCVYLETREIEYYTGIDSYISGEPEYRSGTAFYCALKDKFMLHPKLEHKEGIQNLQNVYFQGEEAEQGWMPKECSEYDNLIDRLF